MKANASMLLEPLKAINMHWRYGKPIWEISFRKSWLYVYIMIS